MKSKTDFKQMYLVDATAYNGMSRVDTPIILGRSSNKVSPPTINVLAPVTSKVENSKTDYPIHKEQKPSMKSVETQNTPPTINVLAPVTSKVENSKTDYPVHKEQKPSMKSVETQSNVSNTKSIGVVTESPPNIKKYDQASQTPIPNKNVRKLQIKYRTLQNKNRLQRDDNRSARDDNHSPQDNNPSAHLHHSSPMENSIMQIENDSQISKEKIPSNTHLQYIVPDPEFQKAMDFSTYQHSPSLPQPQPQHMDTIEYSTPLALPQPQIMNTIQHSPPKALPQPQHMDTIEYSTPLVLPHPQIMNTIPHSSPIALPHPQLMDTIQHSIPLALPQAQLMDTIQHSIPLALPQPKHMNSIQHSTPLTLPQQQPSMNPQINHLPPSRTHPQLMDISTNTQTPQLMDYSVNPQNSASALPAPEEDDCKECAVAKYKKYDVSLPSSRGLPEKSVFICTLCESNFSTKKSLQRHMTNIHDAYNQVEKGIKRKSKQGKISKKLRTSHEIVPYFMYGNPT